MIPTYQINLDLPPEVRWNNVIDDYKDKLKDSLGEINELINQIAGALGKTVINIANIMVKLYKLTGSIMYLDELKSISKRAEIPFERLVLMQLCYEWCSACTSIGMNIGDEEKNMHFRTMDWALPTLEKLTVNLDFYRNGELLFKSVSWVGCVGIMTGMVPGEYTIALNYRRCSNAFHKSILGVIGLKWPVSYLIRHTLETNTKTDQALRILGTAKLVSPCYLTVCSANGKTYVLHRGKSNLDKLRVSERFLIQTNKDDPEDGRYEDNILWSVQRYKLAKQIITESICKEKNPTPDYLFNIFNRYPIINHETIYIVVMDPKNGVFESKLPSELRRSLKS